MKFFSLNEKLIISLMFLLSLTACSDRENGPSEIVNARPISPYYFVKKGETLADVAAKHSMKEEELISLNNLKPPYTLFERQRILVRILGKNNADYTKPGGDIMVKELDVEGQKDINAEDNKDKDKDAAVDPMASSDSTLNDAGAIDTVDSTLSSGASSGKEALVSKGVAAKSAGAAAAPVAFDWPVKGKILTKFGKKMPDGTLSDSLQIDAPVGTKVKAAAAGKVQKAGETLPGFGKIVVVKHADGKLSLYAHLKEVSAKTGQQIAQGQELGRVGKNGAQPMLLFQVRKMVGKKFVPVDPTQFLP
ncbi:MAG: M23 family metallopeptidase [Pseudomonadota bacterium]